MRNPGCGALDEVSTYWVIEKPGGEILFLHTFVCFRSNGHRRGVDQPHRARRPRQLPSHLQCVQLPPMGEKDAYQIALFRRDRVGFTSSYSSTSSSRSIIETSDSDFVRSMTDMVDNEGVWEVRDRWCLFIPW